MKKLIISTALSVLFLCAFTKTSTAQVTGDDLHARFGIKGGVNYSALYTKNEGEETKMLVGYNAGIFAKLPVSRHFSIQPELYYTTKGGKISYSSFLVSGNTKFKLNYIELPVLAVVNVTDNFNIHVGPYVSYLVSGKAKNNTNGNIFNFQDNIDNDDYNKLDAGLAIGLGLDFGNVGIGARYNYGLTKVGKNKTITGYDYKFPNAVNGVGSLYIAISFL